jgi:hypothetical protein
MADMALALTIQDSSPNGHIRQLSITSPIDITPPPRLMIEDGSAADVRPVVSNSWGKI